MRILLAQNSLYFPAHGGGDRSNRLLIEALADRGHACRVVARTAGFSPAGHAACLEALAARGVESRCPEPGVVRFNRAGVDVHIVTERPHLRAYFSAQLASFEPDAVLCSTDDPAHVLLEAALDSPARVVFLARATLALPFGPDCAFPSHAKTDALRRADARVGVSQYVADYIRRWGPLDAVHVPISLMDPPPYPALGRFDNDFVTFVNPCAVKGISIFLELACRFPSLTFAAVPTWGTTAADRTALLARPNVRLLDPVDSIDDLFARTRILLVPSLWAEARSRIIPEAMLRGIPVLAANTGGIPEAMLGQPYLLPVRPIERYQPSLDERMVPLAEVPPQDLAPWETALARLTTEPAHYAELSQSSRAAALDFAGRLTVEPFEDLLLNLQPSARPRPTLSPDRRRLLALRLQSRAGRRPAPISVFPIPKTNLPRLFCFPHAGGGSATFLSWTLPNADILPARLPGRETKIQDPPIETLDALLATLRSAIDLERPFALFGHSLGAIVAFELARLLPVAPACLIASAARAPQFRLNWQPPPDPTDEEFMAELRRLEGVPPEALDNPELLEIVLPALRADTGLYRRYVYTPGPPLACPIFAYGGESDPAVTPDHLRAWEQQTTSAFRFRLFPGGHFYLNTSRPAFLEALAADLGEIFR